MDTFTSPYKHKWIHNIQKFRSKKPLVPYFSETCLNLTLNKPESSINQTLHSPNVENLC